MREAGLQGAYRRKGRRNLTGAATEEDLVHRRFEVAAPDRLWLTDITEHPTEEGKLYCAAVMDAFSRRITGWSIDKRQTTDLVVDALAMAVTRRQPETHSTILHSDHGTQYTSWAFGKRLRDAGLLGSMGTVGDCFDCETVLVSPAGGLTLVTIGPLSALALICRLPQAMPPNGASERAVTS